MGRRARFLPDSENGLQVSIDVAYPTGYRVTINTNPATFSHLHRFSFYFAPYLRAGP